MALVASSPPPQHDDRIRVMIVDDSAVVRGITGRWIDAEAGLCVAAQCSNGREAIDRLVVAQPDVVLLDVEMPEMDGLQTLPKMLAALPGIRILMASALTRRNGETTIRALSLGASDYVAKPEASLGGADLYRRELLTKIKAFGKRRVPGSLRSGAGSALASGGAGPGVSSQARAPGAHPAASQSHGHSQGPTSVASVTSGARKFPRKKPEILVIGCSTGGPVALENVLVTLSRQFAGAPIAQPILVVQHMPKMFTAILAERIAQATGRICSEAKHQEPILAGRIYIAPGDFHMRASGSAMSPRIALDQGAQVNFCRPAVDPMFESAVQVWGDRILGIVLTGMGHDGAAGAGRIAAAGGAVIAQDEATSVVWGMPGAVVKAGFAASVEPLDKIGIITSKLLKGETP